MSTPHIRLIGVPLDLGASRRGVDMGPSAIRLAGVHEQLARLGCRVEDLGNIVVPQREQIPTAGQKGELLGPITAVCRDLAAVCASAVEAGAVPLVLGGDHSLVAGSLAGVARVHAARGQRAGCIYLDTHGDLNTPATSPTGNVHGMPLAHLLGHGDPTLSGLAGDAPALRAEHLVLVGIRDLDAPEKRHVKEWGIRCITMREIDERGLSVCMREAIERASDGTAGFHVSCDMDWVDPKDAPGVGTPVPGGADYREAHLAMELIAETGRMLSLDLVECNPILDERNRTAELAVGLITSAFGLRIL